MSWKTRGKRWRTCPRRCLDARVVEADCEMCRCYVHVFIDQPRRDFISYILTFPSSSCTKPYDSDDLTTPPRSTGPEYHFVSIHTIVKKTRTDVYAHDTKPITTRPAHANKFNLALNSAWVLINALK